MGTFENALKRELGKNTGKAISNLVFGDAHSTPYRRTSSRRSSSSAEEYYAPRKTARQLKEEHLALMLEKEREAAYDELLRKQRLEEEHQREIFRLEQEAERNRIETENLNQLSCEIESALNLHATDFSDVKAFLSNVSAKLSVRNWNNLSFFRSLLSTNSKDKERKKLENQLYDIYLTKFQTVLEESVQILTKADIDIYLNLLTQFCKKRNISPRIQLVDILQTHQAAIMESNEQVETESDSLFHEHNVINVTIKSVNSDNTLISEDTIAANIVNLNENSLIENRLAEIWERYSTVIGCQVERIPIFVTDAIRNSILYVGVNPSFYEGDDNILLHSNNGKALFYENVCGELSPPEYFRELEHFTKRISVDLSYSHLNLLYARENDRKHLLSLDSNFIREQLELTYDLIIRINPLIIVFFSDYCKHLIFGKERWVNPASLNKQKEYYVLNGTHIPVLFTEDVTTLEEPSYLQNKIKNILL